MAVFDENVQFFKGNDTEIKVASVGSDVADLLSIQRDLFLDGAYGCGPLGDLLHDTDRTPLARGIKIEIFRTFFQELFDSFVHCGTFESYITVFTAIFGDDTEITFTVPGNGKLDIDVVATDVTLANFVSRYVDGTSYVFDNMVTEDGDNIMFQYLIGFKTQYELEQLLFEMVPMGVYTTITLTIGA